MIKTNNWVIAFTAEHGLSVQRVGKETKEEDYKICKRVVDEMVFIFNRISYKGVKANIGFESYDGEATNVQAILGLCLSEGMDDKFYCEYDFRLPGGTHSSLQKKANNRLKRFISSIKKEFKKKNISMKKTSLFFKLTD